MAAAYQSTKIAPTTVRTGTRLRMLQPALCFIVLQILKSNGQPIEQSFEYFKNNERKLCCKAPTVQAGEPMTVNDEGGRRAFTQIAVRSRGAGNARAPRR
mmetsp:Transcript_29336/g.57088  ORF Transcript_29336/g.57088 Transcript_29336/m.57088 type:complete len:100 (-) Transcript_29336:5242-5541(-)